MIIIIKTGIHYGDNHYSNDNQKTVFKKMKRSNQLRLCIVNDVDIVTLGEVFYCLVSALLCINIGCSVFLFAYLVFIMLCRFIDAPGYDRRASTGAGALAAVRA